MKVLFIVAQRRWRDLRCKQRSPRHRLPFVGVVLLLSSLLLLLSACTNFFATPTQSGTPSTDVGNTSTATPVVSPTVAHTSPTITTQVTGCPSNLSINWDSLVGTHANINKVQKVICGSLEGAGTLDALIDVRYYSADAKLDYYVYDNLFGTPTRRFSMLGLLNGDAEISLVGTLVTAEVNPGDAIKGTIDLFKEYQWNGTTFGQIIFPAIFPDMTRYQAEQAQALVASELAALKPGQPASQIRDSWRLAAGSVVIRLARNIFHWTNVTVTLPSHSAQLSVLAITVTNLGTGGGGFIAVVHHMNEVLTNIYEVWQVNSINGSAGISSPASFARLTNPVSVSGSSVSTGSILGEVVFYDDMYITIGSSGAIPSPTSGGFVQFTQSVSYHLNRGELEEGVVAFYPTYQNNVALSNQAVMVKVFLSA